RNVTGVQTCALPIWAVPAHDGGRDLVTDRVAEDGRVTGASPHTLSDAALDDPGRFLVAQEGDVLRPRQPDHDPKAEPLGSVEKQIGRASGRERGWVR